jgi:lipid-binding SYLF domain-containing protein
MKRLSTLAALLAAVIAFSNMPAVAQDKGKTAAAELTADSQKALAALVAKVPLAKSLQPKATAILVFPSVKKAGLGIGGQYGEGTLLKGDTAAAFYKTTGASMGLQAGAQQYGYALFLMNQGAVAQLDAKNGFEIGVGPSYVLIDEGKGKSTTTTTIDKDIYAFIFSQGGLMAGLGIQGNKVTKITPK